MAAAALQPVDYPKLIKGAVGAGVLTLVLASLVVGIETISSTGALTYETRFTAVSAAAVGVAIVYFLAQLIKAGRPLVPLVVGGALLVLTVMLALAQTEGWSIGSLAPFDARPHWGKAFVAGAAFAYYILFPPAVGYLLGVAEDFQPLLRSTY